MPRRILAPLALLIALAVAAPSAYAQGSTACQFILGFKALHDLDPADVGACVDNQAFAPNGDAVQHTANGLMAWRKADNWTAFTNGYQTWINGPKGLQKRLNTQRFSWESSAAGAAAGGSPAVPVQAPAGGPAPAGSGSVWSVAFDHSAFFPAIAVDEPNGTSQTIYATGKFLRVYFVAKNDASSGTAISTEDIAMTDAQGRTYRSDFDVRQVRPDGTSADFDGLSVSPGGSIELALTFDVRPDASGLVLHVAGGNDVSVTLPQ